MIQSSRLAFAALLLLLSPACRSEPARALAQAPCGQPQPSRDEPGAPQTGLEIVPLEIRGAGKVHKFRVEIAATSEQQQIGMMFRESVGGQEGMIFPFPRPRPASFWMRNTRIPLDIIFVRADGTIARIAANAKPFCLDSVSVDEPVAAVLEIGGGRAAALGVSEGDRVIWPVTR